MLLGVGEELLQALDGLEAAGQQHPVLRDPRVVFSDYWINCIRARWSAAAAASNEKRERSDHDAVTISHVLAVRDDAHDHASASVDF
jgi:hypothetical protein